MTEHILAALASALICVILLYILHRITLTPVKAGKNTRQLILLSVCGREPGLEQNVRGLLWLNDTGVLRCRIIIIGRELDDLTRETAEALERDYNCVTFTERGKCPGGHGE